MNRTKDQIKALEEILEKYQAAKNGQSSTEEMCPLCYYNNDRCDKCSWSRFFYKAEYPTWHEMDCLDIPCMCWLYQNYPGISYYAYLSTSDEENQEQFIDAEELITLISNARDHRITMIKEWLRQLKSEL